MNLYKYSIQYNTYKKGNTILVKDSIISSDSKDFIIDTFTLRGLRNFKITCTKQLN